jgi:hypothetical protein
MTQLTPTAAMNPANEPFDKISFSLPHSLLEKIDALATADRRSRSSWLVLHLEQLLESAKTAAPLQSVAESANKRKRKGA